MQSIRHLPLQPQGEQKRSQCTGEAIRYAPGMNLDHGVVEISDEELALQLP